MLIPPPAAAALGDHNAFVLGLEVMDRTALTLCMDNGIPIIVFDMNVSGNIRRVVMGDDIGTLVGMSRTA